MLVENENLLTAPEVCGELGISRGAVHNAMTEGRLPFIVMYGRKLISRADLDTYKRRTRPNGEKPRGRPKNPTDTARQQQARSNAA